ncbi:hypothetical protein [Paenibacillus sp. CECT 9249]|nr:hypothetical protein [Paenibacillus sp. CECT 9249]
MKQRATEWGFEWPSGGKTPSGKRGRLHNEAVRKKLIIKSSRNNL